MRRRWLVVSAVALVFALCSVAIGTSAARRAAPTARASADECASLGQAANFVGFSNRAFDASPGGGENITGRIAAAGNVTIGDGVHVAPAAGEPSPTVIAGGDFTAGHAGGGGGSINGGVRYGGTAAVAPNFTINGASEHGPPPFSFADEFDSLKLLSASWADLHQTAGASVVLNQYSHALELTGTGAGPQRVHG
jgi:choice-of-anchor A domain-containing protein